jgi:hypothetical protein
MMGLVVLLLGLLVVPGLFAVSLLLTPVPLVA